MNQKAVILLSGGVDSSTTLAFARSKGYDLYALTVNYGQRHAIELESAKKVAESIGVAEHKIVDLDLRLFGGSALTSEIEVPKSGTADHKSVPITYVPARNTILLALALGWAEVLEAPEIFIGANAVDYSGYPDCRPAFIEAFEKTANLATKKGVETNFFSIRAPLIHLTKARIIKLGKKLGVDFSRTHSCYDPTPDGLACGRCDSCSIRLRGFGEAGVDDPVGYAK